MTPLTSETRCILYCAPSPLAGEKGKPFATAEFTNKFQDKFMGFHKLAFRDYRRDVPAGPFLEMINPEDRAAAFVAPGARTLRGLMDLKNDAMYGIGPGL